MKFLITLLIALANIIPAVGQNGKGNLKGKIQSDDGYPLSGISIQLEGIDAGTTTDENGIFKLKGIPAGTYVIVASGVNYTSRKENIIIKDAETASLDLVLNISKKTLEEVVITSNRPAPYIIKTSSTPLKQNMPLLEVPHSVSVVTQQLIKDQVIVDFQNAFRNVTGVQPGYAGAGYQMVQKARGFEQRTFFRDGIAFTFNNIRDMANIEQVEVLRGPSGTLYGGSNVNGPGALINIITKKPLEYFYGSVGITAGSFGFFRPTFDISTPLTKEKTALFRINGSIESDNGFKDTYKKNSQFIAPSFLFAITDKTTIELDGEYFARNEHEVSYPVPLTGIPLWPRSINATNDEGFSNTRTYAATVKLTHTINSNWKTMAAFQFAGQTLDDASAGAYMDDDTLASRYLYARQTNYKTYSFQFNISGGFNTGKVSHAFIAGVDGFYFKENYYRNGKFPFYDQVNLKSGKFPSIPLSAFEQSRWRAVLVNGDNHSAGIYVQDVIKPIPSLSIVLGARVEQYKKYDEKDLVSAKITTGYNQNAFSPKLGIVFQPILHKLSLFGNYTSGFQFQSGKDFDGNSFKAVGYHQWEGGIKAELVHGKLVPSVTFYQIKATDVVRADPANPGFSIQNGEQKSTGWEMEMAGSPARGLNIAAGYAHNKSIFTKANASVQGKRPNAMPPDVLNVWISYTISNGAIKGLGLGAGANYSGDTYLLPDNATVVPGYTLISTALFYSQPGYRLSLKLDNATDKTYYLPTYGSVDPGIPRRLLASMSIYF